MRGNGGMSGGILGAILRLFQTDPSGGDRDLFEDVDVVITPTTPFAAPALGQARITIDGREVPVRGTLGRFTAPFSFVGLPAMSVPMATKAGALPLGVQIVARPYDEAAVLRVAAALETNGATP